MALNLSSVSCFASTFPNNTPKLLGSKLRVASLPANATQRSTPSRIYALVRCSLKPSDHQTSKEYLHELNITKVKNILIAHKDDPIKSLKMIDVIQGLGIDLHFKEEIDQILHKIYKESAQFDINHGRDLSEAALCFRLLRQEGYHVQESMFGSIRDKKGGFKDELQNDVKGLIELYEASELGVEGDETLDSAKEFAFNRLNELCSGQESHQGRMIMNSLRQPRHKTLTRLTSKSFINMIKVAGGEDDEWLQSILQVAEVDSIILKSSIQE